QSGIEKQAPPSRLCRLGHHPIRTRLNIHGQNKERSTSRQAVDRANVTVAVDRHELTIIQQDIGLITTVTVEPSHWIARLNQQLGQFLAYLRLPRDQVG